MDRPGRRRLERLVDTAVEPMRLGGDYLREQNLARGGVSGQFIPLEAARDGLPKATRLDALEQEALEICGVDDDENGLPPTSREWKLNAWRSWGSSMKLDTME